MAIPVINMSPVLTLPISGEDVQVDAAPHDLLAAGTDGSIVAAHFNPYAIRIAMTHVTLTAADYKVLANTSAGSYTITLPNATEIGIARDIMIKVSGTQPLTVAGQAGQTIDGQPWVVMYQYDCVTFTSDADNWFIF